jgi:hypothetical protein
MKKPERQTYFLAIVGSQLSGNAESRISPGEVCNVRFLFASVSIPLRLAVVKAGLAGIMSQQCNGPRTGAALHRFTMLCEEIFASEIAPAK